MARNRTPSGVDASYRNPWPQRADVPGELRRGARRSIRIDSSGGIPEPARPRTLVNGMIDQVDRFPGAQNDILICRDRGPVWHREYVISGRDSGLVDWTAAGPVRPELHMMQATLRLMQGNSASRNLDPMPVGLGTQDQGHGLHTTPPSSMAMGTSQRYAAGNPQMRRPRVNRLQPAQYAGQSYSETTQLQQQTGVV